ncbi:MAG: nickel-dependent hydrogenase large subunit [Candidatus Aminicenantes bacterium]
MKKINIDHLCRVEGNGGITATIDGNVVSEVKFNVYEGPRLIEKLTLGLTPEEDVSMSPRICAICTLSHKNAILRAFENALDITLPPKTQLLRELMHMGEMIESHSLHTFYLALPDYLGFPNAIAMASKYGFEVKIALEMKHFGNHIMKVISGRYIHGENPVIGGFGKFPTRDELLFLKERAIQFMPFVLKTVDLFCTLGYPDIPEDDTVYACCEPGNGRFGFWGDEILLSNGDKFFRDDYKELTNEFVVPHSYCKRSRYQGKPYSVGALARINVLGERLQGEAGKAFGKYFNKRWTRNPLFHNAAQALEILYSFERIPEIIDEMLKYEDDPEPVAYTAKDGKGTGLAEAPRGLLIHHHEVTDGKVSHVDIITPTAQNAEDIEHYCHLAAQKLLDQGLEDQIRDRMDIVVRAFDPCISCSAHMARVEKAGEENWTRLWDDIHKQGNPVFVGVGSSDHSDDRIGLELARRFRETGITNVWEEDEIQGNHDFLASSQGNPLVFMDALEFSESPGKITLIPLEYVLNHAGLSHKFIPFLTHLADPNQLKNAYVLGIQPQSIEKGTKISPQVLSAVEKILERTAN